MNILKRLSMLKTHAFVALQIGLRALALGATLVGVLFSGGVSAAVVTYTFNGSFKEVQTVGPAENPLLGDAIAPVLGVGSSLAPKTFSVTLSLDTAVVGVAAQSGFPGTQLYRTVISSSSTFAGFSSTDRPCDGSTSEFICTALVREGTGGLVNNGDPDSYSLLASIGNSTEFEAATNREGNLDFQFAFFFSDFFGGAFATNSVDIDLSQLNLDNWSGSFIVFERPVGGQFFDRADFALQIDSIVEGSAPTNEVPEPGSLFLTTLACLMLGLARRSAGKPLADSKF